MAPKAHGDHNHEDTPFRVQAEIQKKTTDAEDNSPPCPTEKNPKLKFPKPALPQAGLLIEHWDIEGGHADLDNPDGLCQN